MKHNLAIGRPLTLLLAILLVAACGTTVAPATPVPPTPTPVSAQTILEQAEKATKDADYYHMNMAMDMSLAGFGLPGPMKVPMVMAADVQNPDRMKGKLTINAQGTTVESEVVGIGQTVYVKDPTTGKWTTSATGATPLSPSEMTQIQPKDIAGLTLVSEESVNGTPAYHLAGKTNVPLKLGDPFGDVNAEMAVDYWVEKDNSRLLKVGMLGGLPLTSAQITGTLDMSVTILFTNYGVPVTVEVPAGVTPPAATP